MRKYKRSANMNNQRKNNDNEFLLKKSNSLLGAKFNMTPLAYDALNFVMLKAQNSNFTKKEKLQIILYINDLNNLINRGKNIYRDTKDLASALLAPTMLIERSDGFEMFNIITNVDMLGGSAINDDGGRKNEESKSLRITFNDSIRDHIYDLKTGYGIEDISITSLFKTYSTKKIYELLIKGVYKLNTQESVTTEYRLSEFKFLTGTADVDCKKVKDYLYACKAKGRSIDWDYAYNELCDRNSIKYPVWNDFKRKVLIPAQKEIKEKADYYFDYTPIREGREYKRIKFIIRKNNPESKWTVEKTNIKRNLENDAKITELIDTYSGHNGLTEMSIRTFYKVSDGNVEAIKNAIALADTQPNLYNYAGWITDTLKNGRAKRIEIIDGSKEKADIIQGISDAVHNNEKDIAKKVWLKYKENDEFKEFLNQQDMTMEEYENAFSYEKRVSRYLAWRAKQLRK